MLGFRTARRGTRIAESKSNLTVAAALLRVTLQAAFLLLLPRWVDRSTAAVTFLSISMAAFINPVAALGSQFNAIKAAGRGNSAPSAVPSFAIGSVVAVALACCVAGIYRGAHLTAPIGLAVAYVLINYIRLFSDALGQGAGRYNVVQSAYVGFWTLKVVLLFGMFQGGIDITFRVIVAVELFCSLPWLSICVLYVVRNYKHSSWRELALLEEAGVTFATLARTAWLEADKLLLPFVVTPSAYVAYTLANRSSTVGIALTSAHLAVLTPQIVRGRPEDLEDLAKSGRRTERIGLAVSLAGNCAVIGLYPDLSWETYAVMAITLALVPIYYRTHVYADYVFYHRGAWSRAAANLTGLALVAVSVAMISTFEAIYVASIGQVLALVAVLHISRHQVGG